MNPRWRIWFFGGLAFAVLAAAIYFPILRRRVRQAGKTAPASEEQARRELLLAATGPPGAPRVKAKLFWALPGQDGGVAAVIVELPLSNDPVLRAKQVLDTLLAGPVDAELRTLPPDAALLEFYLLPDGTGIADFSEAFGTSLPSGVQSERMAIESVARTLEASVPQVQRLKFLIHGQEAETLAGHIDLTGTFVVNTQSSAASAGLVALPAAAPPANESSPPSGKLTPSPAPVKLSQPGQKP